MGEGRTTVHDFTVAARDGSAVDLGDYRGQVLLLVNTASKCGFTPQFGALEDLHQRYGSEGLTVLGFPCNQFGNQDPGSNDEIAEFCQVNYGVTFPVLAKVEVNGDGADPLYRWLTDGTPITWNFTKFLVGRDGGVIARYGPQDAPQSLAGDIEAALQA